MIDTQPPATRHELAFCGVPEQSNGSICRWDGATSWNGQRWTGEPKNLALRWHFAGRFAGVDTPVVRQVIAAVFDLWAKHAALEFHESGQPGDAHILITTGGIDGGSGTLAWSELPCGRDRQLTQKYDTAERWFWGQGAPTYGVSAVAVFCHEIGHALGLEHIERGNLLAPMYTPQILAPQAGDIEQIVLRYGPRLTTPAPGPITPPAGEPLMIDLPTTLPAGRYELTPRT